MYFGEDGKEFQEAVNKLRFIIEPELSTREIINILGPVWSAAYSKGWEYGIG